MKKFTDKDFEDFTRVAILIFFVILCCILIVFTL